MGTKGLSPHRIHAGFGGPCFRDLDWIGRIRNRIKLFQTRDRVLVLDRLAVSADHIAGVLPRLEMPVAPAPLRVPVVSSRLCTPAIVGMLIPDIALNAICRRSYRPRVHHRASRN